MSKNFEKVKKFYIAKLWPLNWVRDAVGCWITASEYQKITGKEYEKE
jgi:hypothetical protein